MALVIGMGVLIVIGLGLLGYGVYLRLNEEPAAATEPTAVAPAPPMALAPALPPPAPASSAPALPFAAALGLPPGSSVKSLAAIDGRLAVAVAVPGGEERILLIDPANGNVVGAVALGAAATPAR